MNCIKTNDIIFKQFIRDKNLRFKRNFLCCKLSSHVYQLLSLKQLKFYFYIYHLSSIKILVNMNSIIPIDWLVNQLNFFKIIY